MASTGARPSFVQLRYENDHVYELVSSYFLESYRIGSPKPLMTHFGVHLRFVSAKAIAWSETLMG